MDENIGGTAPEIPGGTEGDENIGGTAPEIPGGTGDIGGTAPEIPGGTNPGGTDIKDKIKDKVVTVESLSTLHEHNKNTYLPMVDPTGSGTMKIDSIILGSSVWLIPSDNGLEIVFLESVGGGTAPEIPGGTGDIGGTAPEIPGGTGDIGGTAPEIPGGTGDIGGTAPEIQEELNGDSSETPVNENGV